MVDAIILPLNGCTLHNPIYYTSMYTGWLLLLSVNQLYILQPYLIYIDTAWLLLPFNAKPAVHCTAVPAYICMKDGRCNHTGAKPALGCITI